MQSWIIIGVLFATMSGAAAFYYSTTQATIQQLTENNVVLQENNKTLETANQTNLNTIDQLETSYQEAQNNFAKLQDEFQSIRIQNNTLRQRLSEHELDALAVAKPGLVERTIDNASEKALRCFELLSGAPLTEDELNATSPKTFNSECPDLYNTLIK